MSVKTVSLPCPNCGKTVMMTEAFPERPFCSKRCKDIDFGDWASESYQIEGSDESAESWSEDQR
ncbi:DNA gyrase inhibitor YacG [Agaribacterium haliotis]|uniref:DNA gyrase inhibitor YacG n=1 Tax=Agaribacterium haliotis TaxID=2013869 RepID=UPI000BB56281|nr:DNA gyrase inhibitor YacG [Agaribacterium haliotis]